MLIFEDLIFHARKIFVITFLRFSCFFPMEQTISHKKSLMFKYGGMQAKVSVQFVCDSGGACLDYTSVLPGVQVTVELGFFLHLIYLGDCVKIVTPCLTSLALLAGSQWDDIVGYQECVLMKAKHEDESFMESKITVKSVK